MTDYTLYYWPIPFRGHIPRFVLAEAGATWAEPDFAAMAAFKDRATADKPYPFLAPPVLHDHASDSWLSQMPAVTMYLGRKHGLVHDPDQSLRLVCDASDILLEITRSHGAQLWDRDSWQAFATTRLPRWMGLHEAVLHRHLLPGGYLFEAEAPGVADLALAALWHTMVDRLAPLRPLLHATAPRLEAHVDRIAARPAIARLRADWEACPWRYCAGDIETSLLDVLKQGSPT